MGRIREKTKYGEEGSGPQMLRVNKYPLYTNNIKGMTLSFDMFPFLRRRKKKKKNQKLSNTLGVTTRVTTCGNFINYLLLI